MVRWMLQVGPSSLAGVAASTSMGHQDPLEHLEVEVEVGGWLATFAGDHQEHLRLPQVSGTHPPRPVSSPGADLP